MTAHRTGRLVLCLSGLLAVVCAAGGTAWLLQKPAEPAGPAESPPPPGPEGWEARDLTLSGSERTFLWDVEHHGNVLNAHGFKRLADALRDADPGALTR